MKVLVIEHNDMRAAMYLSNENRDHHVKSVHRVQTPMQAALELSTGDYTHICIDGARHAIGDDKARSYMEEHSIRVAA
ncbi:MAG: hypothetical protein JWL88_368 [Parcubacteria group bacterium]|nr:hypothetical protein [Parcubacteria group bacterium]